jgi:hypothetical protein
MTDHHSHASVPTIGGLETIGSSGSLDARGRPYNANNYLEGTNICAKSVGPGCSLQPANHRSGLEFGVLAIGGANSGAGPRTDGISGIISCRSAEDGGYILRGDLWPGKGFKGEEGKKRFDDFRAAFASVLQQERHKRTLHTLGAYGSLRRKLPEEINSISRRIKKAHNPQVLASCDFVVVIRRIVEDSGMDQPPDGFSFTTAQPPFYDCCQRRQAGQTVDEDKEKTPETKLVPPNSRLTMEIIVKDMVNTLRGPSSGFHAARWECGNESVPLIPMKLHPHPDKKSTKPEKVGQSTEHGTARSERTSISPSPSLHGIKAKNGHGSQNDLDAAWPPSGVHRYLEVPNATAPTLSSSSSNSSHSSTLAAFQQFPDYSDTGSCDISDLDSEKRANRHVPQTYHPSLQEVSSHQPPIVRNAKLRHRSRHHGRQGSFPYSSRAETLEYSFQPRNPAPHLGVSPLPQGNSFGFPLQEQTSQLESSNHLGHKFPSQTIRAVDPERQTAEITFTEDSQMGQRTQQEPNNPGQSIPHLCLTDEEMVGVDWDENDQIPGLEYSW